MAPKAENATNHVRVAAGLLILALLAGPVSTHVYWILGGTWGIYTNGVRDEVATSGVRVVATVVVVLLVAAVLVVLARVGWWQQAFVSERMIRLFAWALATVFVLETVAAFAWNKGQWGWWMYGPVSLVIWSARVGGGGLGRRVAPFPPSAPYAAVPLTPQASPAPGFRNAP